MEYNADKVTEPAPAFCNYPHTFKGMCLVCGEPEETMADQHMNSEDVEGGEK